MEPSVMGRPLTRLWDLWVKHVAQNVRTRPVTDSVVKRVVACVPRVVGAVKRKADGAVVSAMVY